MAVDPLTLITLIALPIYLIGAAAIAGLLYLVIRLGVRGGLRDHHRWVERQYAPAPAPAPLHDQN